MPRPKKKEEAPVVEKKVKPVVAEATELNHDRATIAQE